MRKVRAADEAARVQREEQLLRRLFGNASARDAASTVSYRDAMDRAEGLATPDEAFELLARARRSGDDLLARAVGMRALDQARTALPARGVAWSAVLDRWAQDEPPDIDRILIELGALHRASVERIVHVYAARPATSSISVACRRASMREVTVRTLSMISSAEAVHAMGAQSLFQCLTNDSIACLAPSGG